ncbi:HNH endonuclease [Oceanobacillus timonensis]|uniref:HNH endonuclease n=1 Tax=Oceanobacillus timonensis TaxID=1926285 RepID=UPI0009BAE9DF|nr:HNH endonuclease signature motif containing protein [Oceanobacillus timonensis]
MNNKQIKTEVINDRKMVWWSEEIYGGELMGMRMLRKKSLKEMEKVTGVPADNLKVIEKDDAVPAPPPIAGIYMQYLSCTTHHVNQFREILSGKKETFKEGRYISANLKKQVYEKCSNKCTSCGANDNLHIHHVKEFAKGGTTDIDNLILLCQGCHADNHKDNNAYYMLKKGAESNE